MFIIPDNIKAEQDIVERESNYIINQKDLLLGNLNTYVHESLGLSDNYTFDLWVRPRSLIRNLYEIEITVHNNASKPCPDYDELMKEVKIDSIVTYMDKFWKLISVDSRKCSFEFRIRYFSRNNCSQEIRFYKNNEEAVYIGYE